ncbi:hypothetical protein HY504_02760 [Candidatus Wolfebacteria bacterium]|nr:hypothetical protein [Candidatus Wolfebacteria bacterium]
MANSEKLRHIEAETIDLRAKDDAGSSVAAKDAERMFTIRIEMLREIERYIAISRREALRRKIHNEREALLRIIDGGANTKGSFEEMPILHSAYFIQKPLDITMFE